MPGFVLEYDENARSELQQLASPFSPEDYFARVEALLPVRPAYIHPWHFEPETLNRLFATAREHGVPGPSFSPLKILLSFHRFERDSAGGLWTWSAALKSDFKGVPMLFPFFSASGLVMKMPISAAAKRAHVDETFTPLLSNFNITLRFDVHDKSETHDLFLGIGRDRFFRFQSEPGGPGTTRMIYEFARSAAEAELMKDPEFVRVRRALMATWALPSDIDPQKTGKGSYLPPPELISGGPF